MGSLNTVHLFGNLTRDPEVRTLSTGSAVTAFTVACNRTYRKGGPDGESVEEVAYIDVEAWGKQGELVAQYFRKGSGILLTGRLTWRTWEAKDGGKRSKLSVTLTDLVFTGKQDAGPRGRDGSAAATGQSELGGFDEVPF